MRKYAHRALLLTASQAFVFNRTISSDTLNYNLKNDALSNGWNGLIPLKATITINSGVVVSSLSTASYAFSTGTSFPISTELTVINNGKIVGRGGDGGQGQYWPADVVTSDQPAVPGGPGGPGFFVGFPIKLENNGIIGSGGGGGGGGAKVRYRTLSPSATRCLAGGGGGGGAPYGSGGSASISKIILPDSLSLPNPVNSYPGGSASADLSGAGGLGGFQDILTGFGNTYKSYYAGSGGSGGSYGSSGSDGGNYYVYDSAPPNTPILIAGSFAVGGSTSAALNGNSNVTWLNVGTVYGAVI